MTINGFLLVLLVGCLGGVLGEALKWYQLRDSPNLRDYAPSPFYWIITLIMIVLGGFWAVLYGIDNRNAILVATLGLSFPLSIKSLAQTKREGRGGGTTRKVSRSRPSILDFLAGR